MLVEWRETGRARSMHWGVDTWVVFGRQRGKTRAPIQGLDIDRCLFVFGPATPIAPSWECRRG